MAAASAYAFGEATMAPFTNVGESEDWKVCLPSVSAHICSHCTDYQIHVYEVVFKEMGIHIPFSTFKTEVLQWTELTPSPSQLH